MACAPASPRSRLWRALRTHSRIRLPAVSEPTWRLAATPGGFLIQFLSSLALLIAFSAAALAEQGPTRSVLVYPITGHWVSGPLAQGVTQALPEALSEVGISTITWEPAASVLPAWAENIVKPDTPERDMAEVAEHLALAAGAQAALAGEVAEGQSEVTLRAQLVGTISRQRVGLEVSTSATGAKEEQARGLAAALAAKLTGEVWVQAGADDGGRQKAAPERYAAGQAAMAEGRWGDAALHLMAALEVQPDNPEWLKAAGEAQLAVGNPSSALSRYQRLAELRPEREVFLRTGDIALLAAKAAEAESAFLKAAEIQPVDPRATEGLARAARAEGKVERAREHYQQLIASVPQLAPAPSWLASALADERDDSIRLTAVAPEDINLPLARLYLKTGHYPEGVSALLAYQAAGARSPYPDGDYLAIASGLDEEGQQVAQRVAVLTAKPPDALPNDSTDAELDALHERSDRLAGLAEKMQVSSLLDPAHRYRVLAYNLLNQSDFEALMYFRTHDVDRQRRADFWREAFRIARAQAQQLGANAAGSAR